MWVMKRALSEGLYVLILQFSVIVIGNHCLDHFKEDVNLAVTTALIDTLLI